MNEMVKMMTEELLDCFVEWQVTQTCVNVFATHVTYVSY